MAGAFSRNGEIAAVSGEDEKIVLRNGRTGEVIRSWPIQEPFLDSAFTPDGRRLLGAGWRRVQMWDVETGLEVLRLPLIGSPWRLFNPRVAVSHDGELIAAVRSDGRLIIWDGRPRC